mgnify:CR=1 FL=1
MLEPSTGRRDRVPVEKWKSHNWRTWDYSGLTRRKSIVDAGLEYRDEDALVDDILDSLPELYSDADGKEEER